MYVFHPIPSDFRQRIILVEANGLTTLERVSETCDAIEFRADIQILELAAGGWANFDRSRPIL